MEQSDQATPAQQSCPDCHALVADLEAHEGWHSRLIADIATAVVKEMQRRPAASPQLDRAVTLLPKPGKQRRLARGSRH